MRWFVVTPPTLRFANGFTSSVRVSSVQSVSLSTSTTISPVQRLSPSSIALRLPGTAVHVQSTPGYASQTRSSLTLRGPLMTTIVWWGCCSVMRSRTSWNSPTGSSTTGITTEALVVYSFVQGR